MAVAMTRCATCGGLVGADEDEAPRLSFPYARWLFEQADTAPATSDARSAHCCPSAHCAVTDDGAAEHAAAGRNILAGQSDPRTDWPARMFLPSADEDAPDCTLSAGDGYIPATQSVLGSDQPAGMFSVDGAVAAIIAEGPESIDQALRVVAYPLSLDNFTGSAVALTSPCYAATPEATPACGKPLQ